MISALCGVKSDVLVEHNNQTNGFSSVLPTELGGKLPRDKCVSFGVGVNEETLQCIIRNKNEILLAQKKTIPNSLYRIQDYITELFPDITQTLPHVF